MICTPYLFVQVSFGLVHIDKPYSVFVGENASGKGEGCGCLGCLGETKMYRIFFLSLEVDNRFTL
jgi:hypothetical protein